MEGSRFLKSIYAKDESKANLRVVRVQNATAVLQRRCSDYPNRHDPLILGSYPQVHLKEVSIFNLSNLLFPGKSLIDFKEAYVPGDLLVVGNVVQELH